MLDNGDMDGNSTVANLTVNSMLPLDMLAEVAAETLRNDPSLSCRNNDCRIPENDLTKSTSPKRSTTNNDILTLEQIRHLSEKMLLEMFSELSSDEIRKNFSYRCFLMPEKCDKVFSSFGNETKARLQMKAHLLLHITQLLAESEAAGLESKFSFVAEPLHVRHKKLQEECKRRRKAKFCSRKLKNLPPKQCFDKKGISPRTVMLKEVEVKECKGGKFSGNANNYVASCDALNRKHVTRLKKASYSSASTKRIEKENHETCLSTMDDLFRAIQKVDSNCQISVPTVTERIKMADGCIEDVKSNSASKRLKSNAFGTENFKKCKTEYETLSHDVEVKRTPNGQCEVRSPVKQNSVQCSSVPLFCNWETFPCPQHDHTYTSVNGKTYNTEVSEVSKNRESRKKLHKCCTVPVELIIPTEPFPYLYVPVLPHISEIREVGSSGKHMCGKCTHSKSAATSSVKDVCSSVSSSASHIRKQARCRRINKIIIPEEMEADTEDDENVPFTFTTDCVEDTIYERREGGIISESKSSPLSQVETLPSGSPQVRERKVALKCIRALRTKSKDERGPLICRICKDKSFTAQATLMYHYRSHAGIKPFICTVCDATFTRQHSLNYHMLIHNNKSRFMCEDCGRNFRHPSHYKEHLRRHTGETPYQCTDCNLRFKTRNTYKRHLKTRHGKILTAVGIKVLSVEEFNKVRTSPRRRTMKPTVYSSSDSAMQFIEFTPPPTVSELENPFLTANV